jgi:DNA-binding MarR family transcriptional regulator
MTTAPQRALSQLTKSQRKVLVELELASGTGACARISTRQLVHLTGLTRPTVKAAIDRLNELQLIRSFIPPRPRPSEHTLLCPSSERPGTEAKDVAR